MSERFAILIGNGQFPDEPGLLDLEGPSIYAEVERHRDIVVRYQDMAGEEHEEEQSGFLARVIQHEMDHLQGILFVDRLSPAERIRVRAKLGDLERRFAEGA